MDDCGLLQTQPSSNLVALTTHYVSNMVSLLEKISMTTDTWYVAIDLLNTFFSLPIKKVGGKLLAFTSHGKKEAFHSLVTGSVNYLALCHNIVCKDLDSLNVLKTCHWSHLLFNDTIFIRLNEEVVKMWETFVRYLSPREWEINSRTIEGLATSMKLLGV